MCPIFALVFCLCKAKRGADSFELHSDLFNFASVYCWEENEEEIVEVPFDHIGVLVV